MKKILLMMVAFVATFNAFAADEEVDGGWIKSFTPVAESAKPAPVVAQAGEGSVYVATRRGVEFTFAGKSVPSPEIDGSSVIVKYEKDGKEQWAVTLDGAATVTALTADVDGTLYAAGTFMDEVVLTGADGAKQNISNDGSTYSAFVLKVSSDGKFSSVKTLSSAVNEWVASQVGDPWGEGFESPLYMAFDPIDITPFDICLDGDKVYVGASYVGDVAELGWKGSYADQWGMMYSDNTSTGVFSLNKSDLKGAASVMNVQMTGVIAEGNYMAKGFGFTVDGGALYAGFFNDGNLTVTANGKTKDLSADYGKQQYVLATIGSDLSVKTFESSKGDKSGGQYKSQLAVEGENLIIGGHFYGELPFDKTKTSGKVLEEDGEIKYEYWNSVFAASVKKDGTVNWANVCSKDSKATALVVTGEEVHLGTTIGSFTIDPAKGKMEADDDDDTDVSVISDAAAWGDEYAVVVFADENEVYVVSKNMNEEEELEEGLVEIPQSQGTEYDDFKRATLEEGDKYNTYTVTEDLQIAIKMMDVDVKDCDYVIVKFAEPVAAGWRLAFWSNTDLTEVPEGAKEYKYVFADDPKCGVTDGVLPQICMMTFFGGFTAPLEAKVVGIYKHMITPDDINAPEAAPAVAEDGQLFNLLGQPVDENYKGVAITADGKKVYLR